MIQRQKKDSYSTLHPHRQRHLDRHHLHHHWRHLSSGTGLGLPDIEAPAQPAMNGTHSTANITHSTASVTHSTANVTHSTMNGTALKQHPMHVPPSHTNQQHSHDADPHNHDLDTAPEAADSDSLEQPLALRAHGSSGRLVTHPRDDADAALFIGAVGEGDKDSGAVDTAVINGGQSAERNEEGGNDSSDGVSESELGSLVDENTMAWAKVVQVRDG